VNSVTSRAPTRPAPAASSAAGTAGTAAGHGAAAAGSASPLLRRLADPAGPAALVLAAALALAFACWLFTLPFMRGLTSFWQQQDGDIAQYLAGFNAYVREPWQWPLLHLSSINYPDGTLATFLDTVPLYALLQKLWQHGPGTPFRNPYPLWIALCYALQGAGAWWICREARLRSWTALLVLTLLLAAYPALGYRIHHTSLMSQWLLLFGFALYLRGTRMQQLAGAAWVGLLLLAFYINIYLCCMLGLLFVADWLRHARAGQRRGLLGAPLAAAVLLGTSVALTMLPLGANAGGGEWGFGFYSMNLLGPFAGGRLLQFKQAIANEGQGEGYAYVGVFLLAMMGHALRLRQRRDPAFWQRHRTLLVMLVLMTLYALSNTVYLSNTELFHVDLPGWTERFTSLMRCSARFFWPVGYAVILFTVITVQRLGGRRAPLLLLGLLVLQFWDLGPHHQRTRETAYIAAPARVTAPVWEQFLGAGSKTLQVYPPFGCGKAPATLTILPTMLYAVKHELNMSTGYVARLKKPCDHYAQEIAASTAPGTAFVFIKTDFAQINEVEQLLGGKPAATCIEADFAWLCKRAVPAVTENKQ
jgi:hypothetical protein